MTAPLRAGDPLAPKRQPGSASKGYQPARRKRGWARKLLAGITGVIGVTMLASGVAAFLFWRHLTADLPSVDGLKAYQPPVMTRVYAGDGRLLTELATQRRIFVPYSAIPEHLSAAFIAAEDQNFWTNPGIDPLAIARAGVFDLLHLHSGRRPLGASTITQQVAKNMLLGNQMDLTRKIQEAILAIRMQDALSKQQILEIYLNDIYFGQGAYGVAAAAQTYFNKPLDQLSLAQDATLAALPKAPNNYNPFRNPGAARGRRDWVLDRMAEDGAITPAQAAAAKAEPLVPVQFTGPAPIPGGDWMTEEVRRQLVAQFGDMANEGGLTIQTTLDPILQAEADRAVRNGLMAYDRRMGGWRGPVDHLEQNGLAQNWPKALAQVARPPGMLPDWRLAVILTASPREARVGWLEPGAGPAAQRIGVIRFGDEVWHRHMLADGKENGTYRSLTELIRPGDVVMVEPQANGRGPERVVLRQIPKVQGALVCLDPTTGRVLAMVGGWSFETSQFNRATQAMRQPGSSFKPMVYLTALEKGFSPSDQFMDAPIAINTPQGVWRPHNYEKNYGGPTSLRVALEQSLNLVTVRVAQRVGMDAVAKTAEAFGLVDHLPHVLSASLGAVDTTVLREAAAYATLDEGGRLVTPVLFDSVQDREGHVVWRPPGIDCNACDDPAQPPDVSDDRKLVADPRSVFQLINMMEGVVQHGTGVPAGAGLKRPIAGKTGTTQDFQDAWFSGFTPDLVTTVWVGFDTPASLGEDQTGAVVAAPIWHDFMAAALKNRPVLNFPQPQGITMASWESTRGTVTDAFKPGQAPGASQNNGDIYAQQGGNGVGGPQPPNPAAPRYNAAPGVDSSLGGLY